VKFRPSLLLVLSLALSMATAQAHDLLQSNTNLRLRAESMELDLLIARADAQVLIGHSPTSDITDQNFADLEPLLEKAAPGLFSLSVDDKTLTPVLAQAMLSGETDVQFTLIFTRPSPGRLKLASPFINKMPDGFMNSVGLYEEQKVLATGDQRLGDPPWETTLQASATAASSSATAAPAAASASASASGTSAAASDTAEPILDEEPIRLNLSAYLLIAFFVFVVILVPEYFRRKNNSAANAAPPDDSPRN
jgi:hypothetical protein